MNLPSVSIVVLNWNGAYDTLAALTYLNFNVTVEDNGSTDDSLDKLHTCSSPRPLVLPKTRRRLGYAEGNNVGTRHALANGAAFVLVLNSTTVAPDLFREKIKVLTLSLYPIPTQEL